MNNTKLENGEKSFLEIRNLTKNYFPTKPFSIPAIRGIPFLNINNGEFVAISGQSGSGKSTLLNLIGLVDDPTSGEIWINGKNTSIMTEKEKTLFRLQIIGFVFQFFNLLDNFTSLENIIFQSRLQGKNYGQAKKRAIEILDFLNMKEKANLHPSEISGGEQQRIAIGRALAKDSQIILADEPTAHLDTVNAENVISLLRQINQQYKKTIILVTHESHYAEKADRIIRMADGRII